jgi:hypothetical protein
MTRRGVQCWFWIVWCAGCMAFEAWLDVPLLVGVYAGVGAYWTAQLKIHNLLKGKTE